MKKLLIISLILLTVFLIYLTTVDKKIYYLSLGDSLALGITQNKSSNGGYSKIVSDYLEEIKKLEIYNNSYAVEDYRATDIINDINNNKTITINDKKVSIKNALIKSDLVTLSVGINDLFSKSSFNKVSELDKNSLYNVIDTICNDLDKLLKLIREYCKEDVILIGFYNPFPEKQNTILNGMYKYYDNKIDTITKENKVKYLKLYDIFIENPDYLYNSLYPSKEGYEAIANEIISYIKNNTLKK